MSGYGIDQMVLRAERAAREVKPAAIVHELHRRRRAARPR